MHSVKLRHHLNQIKSPVHSCALEVTLGSLHPLPEQVQRALKVHGTSCSLFLSLFGCEFEVKSTFAVEDPDKKKEVLHASFSPGKQTLESY